MNCPTCESCECAQYCGATEIMRKCERHNKKVEQTNEEWLKQANTEQLAEFLNLIIRVGPYENEPKDFWEYVYGRGGEHGAKSIVEWLKQPHNQG